ncbi:hypothetical protein A8144_04385 [Mycobacterium leprae 3125609]|nr:hypothetical protein A8144_04385 [Mycobacterium leprae 3125609]OAX71826.1 hypothetical protein A3216_03285 [Mycobacterium leprae 7935681]
MLAVVQSSTVFITDTPVHADIDRFPVESGVLLLLGCARTVAGVPVERSLALGAEGNLTKFNMAHMGLRLAQRANGILLLHGLVNWVMFSQLWCGFDHDEVADRGDYQWRACAHLGGATVVAAGMRTSWVGFVQSVTSESGCDCNRLIRAICGGSARN